MVCCTGATLVASGLGAVASVAGVSEVSSGIGVEAIRLAGGAPGRGPARRAGRQPMCVDLQTSLTRAPVRVSDV